MNNFDYSSDEVMKILNNPEYNESQKKDLFEKYKNNLKQLRRKEIISKVSEVAKNIPTFTENDYINFMKNYENDDLSKPFDTIIKEINQLQAEKTYEYNQYLESQKKVEPVVEQQTPVAEPEEDETSLDELVPDIRSKVEPVVQAPTETQTNMELTVDNSVLNEEPELLAKPLFSDDTAKDVMPGTIEEPLGEKGNASAIIVSIIAIIIGAVAMYTLIKMN